jgi:hypothetical protein
VRPTQILAKPINWLRAITLYGVTTSGGPNFIYDLCCEKIDRPQLGVLDLRPSTEFRF